MQYTSGINLLIMDTSCVWALKFETATPRHYHQRYHSPMLRCPQMNETDRWSRSSWQDAYSIHRCSGSDLGVWGSVTCVDTSLHCVCTIPVSTTSSFCVYMRCLHACGSLGTSPPGEWVETWTQEHRNTRPSEQRIAHEFGICLISILTDDGHCISQILRPEQQRNAETLAHLA